MAFVWSCGIQFNSFKDAEKAKDKIDKITLSDGSIIGVYKEILCKEFQFSPNHYTLCLMAHQMQIAGDKKLLSFPYFYEVRDTFYHFIHNLDIEFNLALFEFEGADKIAFDDTFHLINNYGIGQILNSNTCPELRVSDTIFQEKRLLDGLVISDKMKKELKVEYSKFFEPYKKGYSWLPVKKQNINL